MTKGRKTTYEERIVFVKAVSYTHLTLPTMRNV